MDIVDRIILLIFVLQIVRSIFGRLFRRGGDATTPEVPLNRPQAPAEQSPEALAAWVDTIRQRLHGGLDAARDLLRTLRETQLRIGTPRGPLVRVGEALDATTARVDALVTRFERQVAAAQSEDPVQVVEMVLAPEAQQALFESLAVERVRTDALHALVTWRTDRVLGEVLADADAIAEALLAPLQRYAEAHDLDFPSLRPLCAPAVPGGEAVIYGLFPDHPVIFVPDDFGDDLLRWPSIAHEIGHVMYWALEGFAADLRALVPTREPPWLPRVQGRSVIFDVQAAYRAWLPEVVADAVAALLLGPSALRGMIHAFERPDEPDAVVVLHGGGDGRVVAEHPPADLRVRLNAWLLERVGYDVEAKALLRGWDRTHGAPDALWVQTMYGEHVLIPTRRFLEPGVELLEALYTTHFHSLAGAPLSAVHDFELGPGLWARTRKRAVQLLEGEVFAEDPRVVIAAAIEASALSQGAHARLAKAVRANILGQGEARRGGALEPRAPRPVEMDAPLSMNEIVDAVLLAELLHRPRFARRR